MHTVVVKEILLKRHPWAPTSLFKAFELAKAKAAKDMRFSGTMRFMIPWMFDQIDEVDTLFSGDPYPYGLQPNRHTLETFCRYLLEQQLLKKMIPLDEHFAKVVEEH